MESHQEVTSWIRIRHEIRHEKLREAPPAAKSRRRHIWLAIQPRCLGIHASQIKSYK